MNIGFYHNVLANLVTCRRDAVVGREAGVVADEHPMSLGLGSNFEVSEGSSGCLGGSFGASGGPGSIRGLRERLQGVLGLFGARPWDHPNHYFWEVNML